MLDCLFEYSAQWGISKHRNIKSNAGKSTSVDKSSYNGRTLEIVNKFSYIEFMFYNNNNFTFAKK